jgi:hypothetical protein
MLKSERQYYARQKVNLFLNDHDENYKVMEIWVRLDSVKNKVTLQDFKLFMTAKTNTLAL